MPPVRAVERALAILSSLCDGGLRLVDLADRLRLHKATVRRLLASLQAAGFVERDDRERWVLGHAVLRLAAGHMSAPSGLMASLHEPLRRVWQATGETVTVHVRTGMDRVCIEEIESTQPIAYRAGIGQRAPLHIGSAGKVLLAFLPDRERDDILRELRLIRITERSITSRERLTAELAKVRRQGYAFSSGERVIGASAVSVPILDVEGRVLAAVSILAPESRLTARQQAHHAAILTREVPRLPIVAAVRGRPAVDPGRRGR